MSDKVKVETKKHRTPELGDKIEFWSKGRWFAAIVSSIYAGDLQSVDLVSFHPISGALPYQHIPKCIQGSVENERPNCWQFPED